MKKIKCKEILEIIGKAKNIHPKHLTMVLDSDQFYIEVSKTTLKKKV